MITSGVRQPIQVIAEAIEDSAKAGVAISPAVAREIAALACRRLIKAIRPVDRPNARVVIMVDGDQLTWVTVHVQPLHPAPGERDSSDPAPSPGGGQ